MSVKKSDISWVKVIVACDPKINEQVSGELFANGAEGVEEGQNQLFVYFTAEAWNPDKEKWLLNRIKRINPGFTSEKIETEIVVWEDWTENWKQNFSTFRVEPNIVVAPDWEEPRIQPGDHLIKISPKMAFGTGHHETTQLILSLLPDSVRAGGHVLDAGTGSGILAVLAVKLGAREVTAFDNDPVAIENALENAELNKVKGKISFFTGYLPDGPNKKYDLITANINRNVLLDLCGAWAEYLQPNGELILSGILKTDENNIRAVYEKAGWQFLRKAEQGEWIAVVLVLKKDTLSKGR